MHINTPDDLISWLDSNPLSYQLAVEVCETFLKARWFPIEFTDGITEYPDELRVRFLKEKVKEYLEAFGDAEERPPMIIQAKHIRDTIMDLKKYVDE